MFKKSNEFFNIDTHKKMFCKFHFFPMVKFSCVQSSFTKPTVVARKNKRKQNYRTSN